MLKILFIGDIVGKLGRKTVAKLLPQFKKELKPDLVIANAENLAHGKGITEATLKEMMEVGVDWFTNGDHAFDSGTELYNRALPILRPANYPPGVAGKGWTIIEKDKFKILLINLLGRVFMKQNFDCPFRKLDEILTNFTNKNLSAIIVDIHADATSEKIALAHHTDGRVTACLGTHTHVMTADYQITKKGMAYITDLGMAGYAEGVIGSAKESIIKTYLEQIKYPAVLPETGRVIFNAILITIDPETKKAISIKPIMKFININ